MPTAHQSGPDPSTLDGGGMPAGEAGVIARALRRLRRVAWFLLVVQQIGWILATAIACLVAAAFFDYFLRTPTWMRAGLWAGGVFLLGWAVWKMVRPALRFHPGLTEVALRIENSEPGRRAGLTGVLAAGLELGREHEAEPVVRRAVERFGGVRLSSVLSGTRIRRVGLLFLLAAGISAGLAAAFPGLAAIGARRILTPWTGVQWPKRTAVADATSHDPHARGTGLLLRAVVLKNVGGLGSDDAGAARVWAKYRVTVGNAVGRVRRVLLTSQDRREAVASGPEGAAVQEGALFEYLIEPWGLTPGGAEGSRTDEGVDPSAVAQLEYWFETEDDQTEPRHILLVEPPSVVAAKAQVTPPAYVGTASDGGERAVELGAGADERAAAPAILAGSRVRLSIDLNKPVPRPGDAGADARVEMLKRVFGEAGASALADPGSSVTFDDSRWTLEWTLHQNVRLEVHVEDQYHIVGPDAAFSFVVLEDRAPAAAVTAPPEDRTLLPDAAVALGGEGRDDVGVSSVSLEYRVAHPPKGSEGAPAEAGPEQTELAKATGERTPATTGLLPRTLTVAGSLDLSALGVKAGDEVWVTAVATDAYAVEGATHEAARSAIRKLRIISQEQLVEQVWAELSGIRRSAMATDEEQSRLSRDVQRGGEASRMERSQAAVSERIARDAEALKNVDQRLRDNNLKDETLEGVMREANRLVDQAGKSSERASQKLRETAEAEQKSGSADAGKRADAQHTQDKVREDLSRLIDLLDQGQDTWATKRAIERMLEEQRALQSRTLKAGERTTGKPSEQLTGAERNELQQIAEEQKKLSDQAAEAVKQMTENEPKLRKNDPAAADAMAEAARQARQQRLQEKMQQASEQVQQNQTNRAQQEQEQAIQSMEQMLQSLQNSAKNRDEVLRRKLASLIESLEALIVDQRGQLELLKGGIERQELKGLDLGMVRLHQNTLGVLDEAAQGPRELQPVAQLIQEAADAQSSGVVALRADPIDSDKAQAHEQLSLDKLVEAKETAERLDREAANRQAQRKRDELKKAYREALATQIGIRAETEPLTTAEQNRRTRATARTLGEREAALQDTLSGIETGTKELADAVMFTFAHKRLDAAVGGAARKLNEGDADQGVLRQEDAAVRVLQQIVQALEEASQKEDDFRQQAQAQQGASGQQGAGQMPVVPPMAEVKLLRSMQEEIAQLTRDASAPGAESSAVDEAAGLQADLAQQGETLLKKLMQRRQRPRPGEGPAGPGGNEPGGGEQPSPPKDGDQPQGGGGGNAG